MRINEPQLSLWRTKYDLMRRNHIYGHSVRHKMNVPGKGAGPGEPVEIKIRSLKNETRNQS